MARGTAGSTIPTPNGRSNVLNGGDDAAEKPSRPRTSPGSDSSFSQRRCPAAGRLPAKHPSVFYPLSQIDLKPTGKKRFKASISGEVDSTSIPEPEPDSTSQSEMSWLNRCETQDGLVTITRTPIVDQNRNVCPIITRIVATGEDDIKAGNRATQIDIDLPIPPGFQRAFFECRTPSGPRQATIDVTDSPFAAATDSSMGLGEWSACPDGADILEHWIEKARNLKPKAPNEPNDWPCEVANYQPGYIPALPLK